MVLITNQTQVSHLYFYLRPKPCATSLELRSSINFKLANTADRVILKHGMHLRRTAVSPRGKNLRISSFKGNPHNDNSYGRDSTSRFSKTPLELSGAQGDKEETPETSSTHNHVSSVSTSSGVNGAATRSLAVKNLFMKWLVILRTQTQTSIQNVDKPSRESSDGDEIEGRSSVVEERPGQGLRAVLEFFLRLDAAISLPLLIFIPWCLAVKVTYGAEVTRELTPLWVLGPLILASYVKLVQRLCSLYVLCFKQAVRFIRDLPAMVILAYNFVSEGKLKEYLWRHFVKPIVEIKNMDYKDVFMRKFKQVQEWVVEKYLDYVESIWPYYCRTIRFFEESESAMTLFLVQSNHRVLCACFHGRC